MNRLIERKTIYWRTNMDCSGGTEKTRTVILVTKKTQRVILVLIVTNSKKTQHDGKPDFPFVPEIHSIMKTQHDGKPDFPCVPEIHSVMKTQHDGKPDFLCVPEIHSVVKTQHDGKPDFPRVPEIRSVPLVFKKIQYDQRSHSMCMMTNPGTDGNKRTHGRKILISQGIMGIFLQERTGFQCIIRWSNL